MHDLGRLLLNRCHDFGDRVADHRGEDAPEEVEVSPTFEVEHIAAFAPVYRDGAFVEGPDERWHHGAVALEQVFGSGHVVPSKSELKLA